MGHLLIKYLYCFGCRNVNNEIRLQKKDGITSAWMCLDKWCRHLEWIHIISTLLFHCKHASIFCHQEEFSSVVAGPLGCDRRVYHGRCNGWHKEKSGASGVHGKGTVWWWLECFTFKVASGMKVKSYHVCVDASNTLTPFHFLPLARNRTPPWHTCSSWVR